MLKVSSVKFSGLTRIGKEKCFVRIRIFQPLYEKAKKTHFLLLLVCCPPNTSCNKHEIDFEVWLVEKRMFLAKSKIRNSTLSFCIKTASYFYRQSLPVVSKQETISINKHTNFSSVFYYCTVMPVSERSENIALCV